MRTKLLVNSCFVAALFLVAALRGSWGSGMAADGTRFDVSLHGVSHVVHPMLPQSAAKHCTYLTGKGAVEFCAPAQGGDAPFAMLCAVFPLIVSGLVLAIAAGLVTYISPYRAKGTGAALTAASLAAVFMGTVVAQLAMPRALQVFDEIPLYIGGFAFTSVWIAMGLLFFAAALSTTTTMLGHT
jgi:hypothetical protein